MANELTKETLEELKDEALRILSIHPKGKVSLLARADFILTLIAAATERDNFTASLDRSPYDISTCDECGKPVVCVPDGMAMCEKCNPDKEPTDGE